MELAQEMTREAYALGQGLEPAQRAALLSRLLYTLHPEVMAAEKKQWAEELFALARQMPEEADPEAAAPSATAPLKPAEGFHPDKPTTGLPGAPVLNGPPADPSFRNEALATAAARLALYDSNRALELLDSLPGERGRREDARTMAARLVFAIYLQQHRGDAGVQTLLAHARQWGEQGGFPYAASAVPLARLSGNEDAAEDFFRQVLAVFERGQEGAFGVGEFGELLERAVAMEAISEESAEEAGRAIVAQAGKLAGNAVAAGEAPVSPAAAQLVPLRTSAAGEPDGSAMDGGGAAESGSGTEAAPSGDAGARQVSLGEEGWQQLAKALEDVRLAAPQAYAQAAKDWPGMVALRQAQLVTPEDEMKVDLGLQASFGELAEAIRTRSGPEALRELIARGLERVNARYEPGATASVAAAAAGESTSANGERMTGPGTGALEPDRQSWALVSLAAYASPMTIGAQLKAIEEPFWRAYFMAIAAQQVGEPTRVADPAARRVIQQEEAEPEE